MKGKFFKKISLTILIFISINIFMPSLSGQADITEDGMICFGSDLTYAQEDALREYFNAPDYVPIAYIDDTVAARHLGYTGFSGGWYSSAYIKLNEDKTGINVKTNNLTLVTDGMLINALITSGITDADIIASAPFPVTGESALAGIFEGAERLSGVFLEPEVKYVAQEELELSIDIADSIGNVQATALISEVKAKVIKNVPKTNEEISDIVSKVAKNLDITITEDTKEKIVLLMDKINDLHIDYNSVKDSIKQNSSNVLTSLKSLGNNVKDSSTLERLWSFVKMFLGKLATSH